MRSWIDLMENVGSLRCWWRRGEVIPVSRMYDHAMYLMDNHDQMGIPDDDILDCDDNEEREEIACEYGWVRINIDDTTIPYIIGHDAATARRALRWVLSQKPNLKNLSVEVYSPDFRQVTLNSMEEIDSFIKGRS